MKTKNKSLLKSENMIGKLGKSVVSSQLSVVGCFFLKFADSQFVNSGNSYPETSGRSLLFHLHIH
jgi:hypothetical protein